MPGASKKVTRTDRGRQMLTIAMIVLFEVIHIDQKIIEN